LDDLKPASRFCDGSADVSQSGQKPVGLPPPPF
jgi:hypothetical protein